MLIVALILSVAALAVAVWTTIELRAGLGALARAMRRAQGLPPLQPGEDPLDAIEHPSRRVAR